MIASLLLSAARAEEPTEPTSTPTDAPAEPPPVPEPTPADAPPPETSLDEPAAPAEGCAAPSTLVQLRFALDTAVRAWTSFDLPALQSAADKADDVVACLGEVIGPEDVGAYWRVQGLVAFSKGDIAQTELSLAVARRVQPTYALPADVVPEQHPLYQMWSAASMAAPPEQRPLAPPIEGWTQVDGRRSGTAPANAPFLFQWVKDSGVASTERVSVGRTPAYEVMPPPPPDRHVSRKLLLGGVATGVLGGGALTTAGLLRMEYNASPPAEGPLEGLKTANFAFGVTGLGLSAVAAGLGASSLAVHDW